ncbi:MAG: pseudouridine synthase [Pseudomonadota bacterium]|nr:pseudouridine synthase [Pseudomonadota bacterium]
MSERLQKWLASLGFGSRRAIEKLITEGKIKVNGVPAELGLKVDGSEKIEIDGQLLKKRNFKIPDRTLIYNKPADEICSRSDEKGRRTVFQSLPKLIHGRWVSVGRLDYKTTGLLLMTTNGSFANLLMHPSSQLEREYVVRALGDLSKEQLTKLINGVRLEDGLGKFEKIELEQFKAANKSYRVTVREGRNRIVRRLFEAVGCRVNRLIRIRYGCITLPRKLKPGEYLELDKTQVEKLHRECLKNN